MQSDLPVWQWGQAGSERGGLEGAGEQAVVTNLGEGAGEQVLAKASHKGGDGENRSLFQSVVRVVTIGEGDGVRLGIEAFAAQVRQPDADLLVGEQLRGTIVVLGQRRHAGGVGVDRALGAPTNSQFTDEFGS